MRHPWVWIILISALAGTVVPLCFGLYQQLHLGEPWGSHPLSDRALIMLAMVVLPVALGICLLLYTVRLHVLVDSAHLHIRYRPFVYEHHSLGGIVRWTVRTYRPIRDFGGWGIRWSWLGKGWAYSISGNRGVQLEFASGRRLLIGSQRPEELALAIATAKGRQPDDGPLSTTPGATTAKRRGQLVDPQSSTGQTINARAGND